MKKRTRKIDGGLKKIERCLTENCQEDTWPNCSMNKAIQSMIESIGKEWKKIGDDGRKICSPDTTGIRF